MNPEEITSEIRRLAHENGGKPLGERLFLANTGLARSALWSAGFSSYSDALIAAGFSKNLLNTASQPKVVLSSLVDLTRSIGRFPRHIKAARAKDKSFPSYEAFKTVAGGAFSNLASVALQYCQANGITDIEHLIPKTTSRSAPTRSKNSITCGCGLCVSAKARAALQDRSLQRHCSPPP